jgi:hypothetical protein
MKVRTFPTYTALLYFVSSVKMVLRQLKRVEVRTVQENKYVVSKTL